MKSTPILFSGPMVRAILDGTKTQTRRIVKTVCDCGEPFSENSAMSPEGWQIAGHSGLWSCDCCGPNNPIRCTYGVPGDQLWARETFATSSCGTPVYRADARDKTGQRWLSIEPGDPKKEVLWKPSIFMRREHSRITLEITGIRVQRLNEISPGDCDAEGIERTTSHTRDGAGCLARVSDYRTLWEKINGPGSWDVNPFVWVIEFNRITP